MSAGMVTGAPTEDLQLALFLGLFALDDHGIRMAMSPPPVFPLFGSFYLRELDIVPMIFLEVKAVGPILLIIPLMIVFLIGVIVLLGHKKMVNSPPQMVRRIPEGR